MHGVKIAEGKHEEKSIRLTKGESSIHAGLSYGLRECPVGTPQTTRELATWLWLQHYKSPGGRAGSTRTWGSRVSHQTFLGSPPGATAMTCLHTRTRTHTHTRTRTRTGTRTGTRTRTHTRTHTHTRAHTLSLSVCLSFSRRVADRSDRVWKCREHD